MGLGKHVKTKFLAGFFILVPAIVTIYVVYAVVTSLDAMLYPLVRRLTLATMGKEFFVPGGGFVLLVLIAYVTGLVTTHYMGKKMLHLGEVFFTRIPFIKSIYTSVKDMTDAFSSQTRKAFKEVVLVHFPFRGSQAVGFITGRITTADRGTLCSVFVPTTPNPTSGFLILVPEEEVTLLHMSVDEALKYTISLGTTRVEMR